jgi:hypothetical protein
LPKSDLDVAGALGIVKCGDNNGASSDQGCSNLGSNLLCNKTAFIVVDLVHPDITGNLASTLSPP